MEMQECNLLAQFAQTEGRALNFDFNGDGKVDMEDYNMAIDYMKENNTDKAFGMDKIEIEDCFAQFVSELSSQQESSPISFKKGENTFHFYEDRDNNGTLDDSSELLGAKSGWEELKAYDLDGDGKIDGEELKNLKVVKVNTATGKYEFMTAFDAGINEIDLGCLSENSKSISENISQMSLDIKMLDGTVLSTMQNEDILKSLEDISSLVFGSKITDYSENPNNLSYMEDYVNEIDVQSPIEGV